MTIVSCVGSPCRMFPNVLPFSTGIRAMQEKCGPRVPGSLAGGFRGPGEHVGKAVVRARIGSPGVSTCDRGQDPQGGRNMYESFPQSRRHSGGGAAARAFSILAFPLPTALIQGCRCPQNTLNRQKSLRKRKFGDHHE